MACTGTTAFKIQLNKEVGSPFAIVNSGGKHTQPNVLRKVAGGGQWVPALEQLFLESQLKKEVASPFAIANIGGKHPPPNVLRNVVDGGQLVPALEQLYCESQLKYKLCPHLSLQTWVEAFPAQLF